MKKLVLFSFLVLAFCACNRMRVQHDHSKKMESARLPVDSAQKNYVDDVKDENWKDEDIVVIPDESGSYEHTENVDDVIERIMRGESVDEEE